MKTITAIIAGALVVASVAAIATSAGAFGPGSGLDGSTQQPFSAAGLQKRDINSGGFDTYNQLPVTSDTDADSSTDKCGQDAYWGGTGGHEIGGSCTLGGGIGSRLVTCTSFGATADGDTLAIAVTKDGTTATTTLTAKAAAPGAGEWLCAVSANACCTALNAYLVANPVAGIASTSNATAGVVGFVPSPDTGDIRLTITEAGGGGAPVFGTATNSSNGGVWFGQTRIMDGKSDLYFGLLDSIHLSIPNNPMGASELVIGGASGIGQVIKSGSGFLDLIDSTEASDLHIDASAISIIAPLRIGNSISGPTLTATSDNLSWDLKDNSAAALTVGATGAASILATDTTNNAESVNIGSNRLGYTNPAADTAPTAARLQAPNAYAQSTGGNQTGATQYINGGIGSREYSCLDIAGGDVVLTTTANGSAVALTGGVAGAGWLYGVSCTTSAENLCHAIEAHGTLGPLMTCTHSTTHSYLQPKAGLRSLVLASDQHARTDPLSGTDGDIAARYDTSAAAIGLDVSYGFDGTLAGVGYYRNPGGWNSVSLVTEDDGLGGTAGGIGVEYDLSNTVIYALNGSRTVLSEPGGVGANWSVYTGGCYANTGSDIGWNGQSHMSSPSDGELNIMNNAETRGVKLNVNTDGVLSVSGRTDTGSIKLDASPILKGQILSVTSATANCTFPGGGGATTCSTVPFVPQGATVVQVTGRQTTPATTCTTCDAGFDMGAGLDTDQIGALLECDVDDRNYTAATATTNIVNTCTKAGGCPITMTANGGDCVSGVTAWTVHYISATAATSD